MPTLALLFLAMMTNIYISSIIGHTVEKEIKMDRKLQDTDISTIYDTDTSRVDNKYQGNSKNKSQISINVDGEVSTFNVDRRNNHRYQSSALESGGVDKERGVLFYRSKPRYLFMDDENKKNRKLGQIYRKLKDKVGDSNYLNPNSQDVSIQGYDPHSKFIAEDHQQNVESQDSNLYASQDNSINTGDSGERDEEVSNGDVPSHKDSFISIDSNDSQGHKSHSFYDPEKHEDKIYQPKKTQTDSESSHKPFVIINSVHPSFYDPMHYEDKNAHVNNMGRSHAYMPGSFSSQPVTIKDVDALRKLADEIVGVYGAFYNSTPKSAIETKTMAEEVSNVLSFYDKVAAFVEEIEEKKPKLHDKIKSLSTQIHGIRTNEALSVVFFELKPQYEALKDHSQPIRSEDPNFEYYFKEISDVTFKFASEVNNLRSDVQQLLQLHEFYNIEIETLGEAAGQNTRFVGLDKYDKVLQTISKLTETKMEIETVVDSIKHSLLNFKSFRLEMEAAIHEGNKLVDRITDSKRPAESPLFNKNGVFILSGIMMTLSLVMTY